MALFNNYAYSGKELFNELRYLTSMTRQKLSRIINKLNNEECVSLNERIILNKYVSRFPNLSPMIKKQSLKSF